MYALQPNMICLAPCNTFFTGLSTRGAWYKNIISGETWDWLQTWTCDRYQPIERMEDNEDWVTCIFCRSVRAVCGIDISSESVCNKVRTLGKHLRLQDQSCMGANQRTVKVQIPHLN